MQQKFAILGNLYVQTKAIVHYLKYLKMHPMWVSYICILYSLDPTPQIYICILYSVDPTPQIYIYVYYIV